MARAVLSSLDGLCTRVAALIEQQSKSELALERAYADLKRMEAERNLLLAEYRSGMFCSGCGRTRSQIEAKGEQFPHSGQSIVRATPAQIDAKALELQRPIDAKKRDREKLQTDLAKGTEQIELGVEQIVAGRNLWRTAKSDWVNRHERGRDAELELREAQLADLSRAVDDANALLQRVVPGSAAEQSAAADLALLERSRQRGIEQKEAFWESAYGIETRQRALHGEQYDQIMAFGARGNLNARLPRLEPLQLVSPSSTVPALGGLYLMGRLPAHKTGTVDGTRIRDAETLGSVLSFVETFRGMELSAVGLAMSRQPGTSSARPRADMPAAKRQLLGDLP